MRWEEREKGNIRDSIWEKGSLGGKFRFWVLCTMWKYCWRASCYTLLLFTSQFSSEICSLKVGNYKHSLSRKQRWNIYFQWIPHSAMLWMMSLQTWQSKSTTHACACFRTVYVVGNIVLVTVRVSAIIKWSKMVSHNLQKGLLIVSAKF